MRTSSDSLGDDEAIRLDRVTKIYAKGYGAPWSGDLREETLRLIHRWTGQEPPAKGASRTLEAVSDVSLEIKRGENVALLGRNGSGKTTVLKLIARVTRPNRGTVWQRGRIAPLIQLGAGFHRDLTGRENLYMLSAILGMSRKEIDERYADIVAFAELEEFMETPLKKYSSGMSLRLGFSVAVHSEPDVFLIDEVLAVGDEAFRRKCEARMQHYVQGDATLVFVSHDLDLVRRTCQRCILLDHGKLVADGPTSEVIELYLKRTGEAEVAKTA